MSTASAPELEAVYALPGRSTRAIVDLDLLAGNARLLAARLPSGMTWMAVVKANAYGHGAVPVASTLLDAGAAMLGVATIGEGRELRSAGIRAPVLVLGPIDDSEIGQATTLCLDIMLGSAEFLTTLLREVEEVAVPLRLHLKVETGMSRFGVPAEDAVAIARRFAGDPRFELVGLSTHFASSDDPKDETSAAQLARFSAVVEAMQGEALLPAQVHIANSGGALRPELHFGTMARLGIALYGCAPGPGASLPAGVAAPMAIVSRLRRVALLPPGAGVSYGHTYRSAGEERVGLVPVGYADGYSRALSNRAAMVVAGERRPVRGRVCMDQTVIGDLTGHDADGDLVQVAGDRFGGPSWAELAALAGTIPYELLTAVSARVPRFYLRAGSIWVEGSDAAEQR